MAETHSLNDLTNDECFALVYVQMLCMLTPLDRKRAETRWKEGQEVMDKLKIPAIDRKKMLADGLNGLRERGIVECTRDGEGDLVPSVYHPDRITDPNARVVMGDMQ